MKTRRKMLLVLAGALLLGNLAFWGTRPKTKPHPKIPFRFSTTKNAVTIAGYTGPSGDVTIPETIVGLSVTTIENGAFSMHAKVFSISIPDSVIDIAHTAFLSCMNLTNLEVDPLNPAYSSLEGVLFDKHRTTLITYPCGKIGTYTIPNSVTTIGNHAFGGCTRLNVASIPNSVSNIGAGAFSDSTAFDALTIPSGVASIGHAAFASCPRLTSVSVGNGVHSIGSRAFAHCPNLTNIALGNGVATIGEGAFAACTALIEIEVASPNSAFSSLDGILFDKHQTTLIQCPGGKSGSYTIPESVTAIGSSTFWGCTKLTSIAIPDSVTTISEGAFFHCINLTTVYFKGDAPAAASDAFHNSPKVTVYHLPGTKGWGTTLAGRPTAIWKP